MHLFGCLHYNILPEFHSVTIMNSTNLPSVGWGSKVTDKISLFNSAHSMPTTHCTYDVKGHCPLVLVSHF